MKLFIVEDDHLIRQNLELLLGGEREVEVVGTAANVADALAALSDSPAEIVLSDIGLPDQSGIELIAALKAQRPELEVMAYTVFEDRETVFAALKAGATSYVLKGSTPRELIEALHSLNQGGAPMSPKIARAVIQEFQARPAANPEILSRREAEVLSFVEQGLSYKEIANNLHLSPHTVHSHIKKIYEKLQANGKHDALEKARRKGLI
ncbi:MAG: response regulator [Polyangiaceae bacterium]